MTSRWWWWWWSYSFLLLIPFVWKSKKETDFFFFYTHTSTMLNTTKSSQIHLKTDSFTIRTAQKERYALFGKGKMTPSQSLSKSHKKPQTCSSQKESFHYFLLKTYWHKYIYAHIHVLHNFATFLTLNIMMMGLHTFFFMLDMTKQMGR